MFAEKKLKLPNKLSQHLILLKIIIDNAVKLIIISDTVKIIIINDAISCTSNCFAFAYSYYLSQFTDIS